MARAAACAASEARPATYQCNGNRIGLAHEPRCATAERLGRDFVLTAVEAERLAWAAPSGPQRIAITGASGMIGSALGRFLAEGGHQVLPLVRGKGNGVNWDPEQGTIDARALEGIDAVVHLAGEPIAGKPWTPEFQAHALRSREAGTLLIARTIAGLERPPKVFVSASAVGYYGDGGDQWLDEASPSGSGYLAEVCRRWEAATEPAAKIRTVRARIGLVLSLAGGPLVDILKPFRLGVGGAFGEGRQYMPWIAINDAVGALHHAIFDPALQGAVNLVAPHPERNRDFARILGRVLRRPSFATAPAFALRAILGTQKANELLLMGQRLRPARLEQASFRFSYPELEPALRHLLGR